jgi:hypothetical protein
MGEGLSNRQHLLLETANRPAGGFGRFEQAQLFMVGEGQYDPEMTRRNMSPLPDP